MIRFPVSRPYLGDAEQQLVARTLEERELTYGPTARRFEEEFAAQHGVRFAVATTSGTTALHLALAALGLGPEDEVIVPDLTFAATANAVRYTGARVVLADVDPETWTISPADAESKTTKHTRAILPVHLYGNPCHMAEIAELARRYRLHVIEDAAEGLGGAYRGTPLGALGLAGIFSFYANKVMTTGEGGAAITGDGVFAGRMQYLRGQAMDAAFGRKAPWYFHSEIGFNYRMTAGQAALGLGQLSHLEDMLAKRREIFVRYASRLCYDGAATPRVLPDATQAPWLFTLQLDQRVDRESLMARLLERGVETRPTFVPLHRLPPYRKSDYRFPCATKLGDHGLSLPTYPELTLDNVDEISEIVLKEMKV
jgi:perosamine synthetase